MVNNQSIKSLSHFCEHIYLMCFNTWFIALYVYLFISCCLFIYLFILTDKMEEKELSDPLNNVSLIKGNPGVLSFSLSADRF